MPDVRDLRTTPKILSNEKGVDFMAKATKQLNLQEDADGVLGVIISRSQYREYVELQAKRDRSELSMRARMIESIENANELARHVIFSFERTRLEYRAGIVHGQELYELAQKILEEGKY